jgi:hypothetical protein
MTHHPSKLIGIVGHNSVLCSQGAKVVTDYSVWIIPERSLVAYSGVSPVVRDFHRLLGTGDLIGYDSHEVGPILDISEGEAQLIPWNTRGDGVNRGGRWGCYLWSQGHQFRLNQWAAHV